MLCKNNMLFQCTILLVPTCFNVVCVVSSYSTIHMCTYNHTAVTSHSASLLELQNRVTWTNWLYWTKNRKRQRVSTCLQQGSCTNQDWCLFYFTKKVCALLRWGPTWSCRHIQQEETSLQLTSWAPLWPFTRSNRPPSATWAAIRDTSEGATLDSRDWQAGQDRTQMVHFFVSRHRVS